MPQAITDAASSGHDPATPHASTVVAIAQMLAEPGLVVITGAAGSGRTSLLKQIAQAFRGPVYTGGGLSMLRGNSGLALSRAVRAKMPVHDVALCAEAVRSRVRNGLLVIDDLQWCDPVTLAVLPHLAKHCRVVTALRTPHRLPEATVEALQQAATFHPAPPIDTAEAITLVHTLAPGLADSAVAALVRRAGGNLLVLSAMARSAQRQPSRISAPPSHASPAVHAIAEAIADLPRPERTALAALGLLGRPASVGMLGPGAHGLQQAHLVTIDNDVASPISPFTAEVAAGLLDPDARAALHRKLAELVDDLEAARHLAACGDTDAALARAKAAAALDNRARRAEALLFAVSLPGEHTEADRLAAAEAALAVGRPRSALKVLTGCESLPALILAGHAHLHAGDQARAESIVAALPEPASVSGDMAAEIDRIALLTAPTDSAALVHAVRQRHGNRPDNPGLAAALAAAEAAAKLPGWTASLAVAAATAGRSGDALSARWSAWLLVENLINDGNLTDAAVAAAAAARACTSDHAFSWQTRFLAAQLWCEVLAGQALDSVTDKAVALLDHALPSVARGYASAAASLAEADTGSLRNARYRLNQAGPVPESVAQLLRWVAGEAAWLDNQPQQAAGEVAATPSLVSGLGRITGYWAAHDGAVGVLGDDSDDGLPEAARATVAAWNAATSGGRGAFESAAAAWRDLVRREQVRCLLAAGVHAEGPGEAVPSLEEAERLADEAGLTVLAGRARQGLRKHHIRRDRRGRRAGDELTERERQVLAMVADGEPTRRIAGALGITRETVETHIRAGMRKLGAKTRTEAAVRAAAMSERGP
ncbi:regulatory LuxR family protein [Stackebrandtia endophytica]|uniref:Regulatory LuxR family protein n=1 Tax=Stackebrandtia endophytica TaxID=1496996 RepID=A0A543APN8_9ACTN|nr:LuxR C-terminal-related transcriptional regulator [Stackebrandtia endophytica]TQL74525.1 regulatory LuxR family protein [Stackebrandtia endophytica]